MTNVLYNVYTSITSYFQTSRHVQSRPLAQGLSFSHPLSVLLRLYQNVGPTSYYYRSTMRLPAFIIKDREDSRIGISRLSFVVQPVKYHLTCNLQYHAQV